MTKIKICGVKRESDILVLNELKPDYIGFVFAKKSVRYVAPEQAARLKKLTSDGISTVGVFVDEPIENVARLLDDGVIDIAQLHGRESEEYIIELKKLTVKPIIKAFGISCGEDIERAKCSSADYVLLDNVKGGSGIPFDITLVKDFGRDFFLAGGLNPLNVEEAIKKALPYAVDVSSGVETDGNKDENKIREFVFAVRKI